MISNEIQKAGNMRPTSIKLSKKEQRAWKAFNKIVGKDKPNYFQFASTHEMVNTAISKFRKIIIENNMDIKKIKKKYSIKKVKIKNAMDLLQMI
jgi:hypothetical protein